MQKAYSLRKLTYFQPRSWPQPQQNISATVCIPDIISLSSSGPIVTLTLYNNAKRKKTNEPKCKNLACIGSILCESKGKDQMEEENETNLIPLRDHIG